MPAERKPINVEFLIKMKELLGVERVRDFAEICGKQTPNMTNYLNGTLNPGRQVLEDCLLNATISQIFKDPLREVEPIPKEGEQGTLPESGGVYVLYDSAANVLYIGKAKSFRAEVWQTLNRSIPVGMRFGPDMKKTKPTIRDLASYMSLYQIDNERFRHNIEALLIRVFINQTHNRNIANFK